MAPRKPPRPRIAPEGQALQWEHLDPESQRSVKESWHRMGKAKSSLAGAMVAATKARDKPGAKEEYVEKQRVRLRTLAAVAPRVKDIPMTIPRATRGRITRVQEAQKRAEREGGGVDPETGWNMPKVPRGTGWYFQHHAEIAAHAAKHGIPIDKAVTATTALSPQNNPTTELKGGAALMDLVANQHKHTVTITPELHERTAGRIAKMKGPPIPEDWIGKTKKISELHSTHIAGIASQNAQMRNAGHPVQSTANFGDLGATRLSDEIQKGVEHLRGQRSELETIDPHSSPKVWSYKESTKGSVPGSKTHLEYLARGMDFQRGGPEGVRAGGQTPAGSRAGGETPHEQLTRTSGEVKGAQAGRENWGSTQHRLAAARASLGGIGPGGTLPDIRGLRSSQAGVLSSHAHTAEDTWMQSISTGQRPESVPSPSGRGTSRTSVAKTVGSDPDLAAEKMMRKKSSPTSTDTVAPDPRIGGGALNHAINNFATRSAASKLELPATMVQEVGWTEQRIRADKDPEYAREQVAKRKAPPKQAPPMGRQFNMPNPNVAPANHAQARAAYEAATKDMKPTGTER